MTNVINWVKNNKVVTSLGVLVLGGIALALTASTNEEPEVVETEVIETEATSEVMEEPKEEI